MTGKIVGSFLLSLALCGPISAQEAGPTMQVQGRNGTVNMGTTPDGRGQMQVQGRNGTVNMGTTPDGRGQMRIDGANGSVIMQSPIPVSGRQGKGQAIGGASGRVGTVGSTRGGDWNLSRGQNGELILAGPDTRIQMGRGPQAQTVISTGGQNYTIQNDLLMELLRADNGRDWVLEQLGR